MAGFASGIFFMAGTVFVDLDIEVAEPRHPLVTVLFIYFLFFVHVCVCVSDRSRCGAVLLVQALGKKISYELSGRSFFDDKCKSFIVHSKGPYY